MMSKADDAFLHVHLDHVQPESQSQDHTITSRSAFGCKIQTVQEPDLALNSKDAEKMSMPRLLAKGHCIPGVGSKR